MKQIKQLSQRSISTRFGDVPAAEAVEISFENGLLGFGGCKDFYLSACPLNKFSDFMILSAVSDPQIGFMLKPINNNVPEIIAKEDIERVAVDLELELGDIITLLICSVVNVQGIKRICVNAKAPVFIDRLSKKAYQYVLYNADYEFQHLL
jgi:flagellar assembly factor FliW